MRLSTFILPVIALSGLGISALTIRDLMKKAPEPPPPYVPAAKPFDRSISGAGIIEPSSEAVDVASELAGVVVEVAARHGARVKKGDVLFRLDERHLASELAKAEAERRVAAEAVTAAEVGVAKLKSEPRPETLPALKAKIAEIELLLADDRDRLDRERRLKQSGATTDRGEQAAAFAVGSREAQLARARADLALAEAGAWAPDVAVATAAVRAADARRASAEVAVAAVKTDLERLVVRAPIDGEILQVNIRVGEGVVPGASVSPIVMGETSPLHIRVDLDENDASRFVKGAAGRAYLRGHQGKDEAFDIAFVRVDPYVIPKRALTGSVFERVDTRVLQVIYKITAVPAGLVPWCGQQVEVFIEDAAAASSRSATPPLPK